MSLRRAEAESTPGIKRGLKGPLQEAGLPTPELGSQAPLQRMSDRVHKCYPLSIKAALLGEGKAVSPLLFHHGNVALLSSHCSFLLPV